MGHVTTILSPPKSSSSGDDALLPSLQPYLFTAVSLTIVCAAFYITFPNYISGDATWYRMLGEGRMSEVVKPFANRFLYPWAARVLHDRTGVSLHTAFACLATLSCAILFSGIMLILRQVRVSPWMGIAFIATPVLPIVCFCVYLPELAHAALLALFLLALVYRCDGTALLLIVLLQMTRESTMLLALVTAVVYWRRSRPLFALAVIGAMLLGMMIAARATRDSAPDIHHLGALTYLVLKGPFNLAKNVFGIRFWSNTLEHLQGNPPPVWTWKLPPFLQKGELRTIGLSRLDWFQPSRTITGWLSTFGVVPVLMLAAWYRRRKEKTHKPLAVRPAWLAVAICYGIASMVLAPAMGNEVVRLAAQGWPAFLLGGPVLLNWVRWVDRRTLLLLLAVHGVAAWGAGMLLFWLDSYPGLNYVALVVSVAASACAVRICHPVAKPVPL